jgi:MFS family permease
MLMLNMPSQEIPKLYSPSFIAFGFANFFTVSSFGIFFLLPLFLKSRGGSESDIGVVMGVFSLAAVLCRPWISEMIDRFGLSLFFLTASAIAGLGLIIQLPLRGESFAHGHPSASHSFFSVLVKTTIFPVAMIALVFGIGLAATENFISPFAKEQGIPFISLFYICYSSAAVVTGIGGGRLADRVGEVRIIPYSLLLTGGGLMALILPGGSTVPAISGLMSGCGHGFLFPCLNSLLLRNEPIEIRGKITGVFTGGIDAGAYAGSIALGYIGELEGFQALFLAASLALLMGLAVHRFNVKASPAWPQTDENRREHISLP